MKYVTGLHRKIKQKIFVWEYFQRIYRLKCIYDRRDYNYLIDVMWIVLVDGQNDVTIIDLMSKTYNGQKGF